MLLAEFVPVLGVVKVPQLNALNIRRRFRYVLLLKDALHPGIWRTSTLCDVVMAAAISRHCITTLI